MTPMKYLRSSVIDDVLLACEKHAAKAVTAAVNMQIDDVVGVATVARVYYHIEEEVEPPTEALSPFIDMFRVYSDE